MVRINLLLKFYSFSVRSISVRPGVDALSPAVRTVWLECAYHVLAPSAMVACRHTYGHSHYVQLNSE
jgi:hypothetical protein